MRQSASDSISRSGSPIKSPINSIATIAENNVATTAVSSERSITKKDAYHGSPLRHHLRDILDQPQSHLLDRAMPKAPPTGNAPSTLGVYSSRRRRMVSEIKPNSRPHRPKPPAGSPNLTKSVDLAVRPTRYSSADGSPAVSEYVAGIGRRRDQPELFPPHLFGQPHFAMPMRQRKGRQRTQPGERAQSEAVPPATARPAAVCPSRAELPTAHGGRLNRPVRTGVFAQRHWMHWWEESARATSRNLDKTRRIAPYGHR